jgi:hypothetical protein
VEYTRYNPGPRHDPRRRRRQQARRRLLLLIVLLIIFATIVAAVATSRHKASSAGSDTSATSTAKGASARPTTPPPKVWVATASAPVRVWVGGDSLGGELGWGLGPLLDKASVFTPVLFYKESSGIARWDFFDWGKKIRSVMRTVKPNAVVVMMGTNDTQSLWRDGTWVLWGKPAWRDGYGRSVGAMMQTMLDGGARRVYWVGMPIMSEGWRNSRMKLINGIVAREAARHPGVRFIDVWPLFSTSGGAYAAQWRGPDGVHFTVAGQERLAKAVFAAVKKDWAPHGLPSASASPAGSPSVSSSPSP